MNRYENLNMTDAAIGHNHPPAPETPTPMKIPLSFLLSAGGVLATFAFGYGLLHQNVSSNSNAIQKSQDLTRENRELVIELKTNQNTIIKGIEQLQRQQMIRVPAPTGR